MGVRRRAIGWNTHFVGRRPEFGAEWTPDGRELVYSSERPFFDLYRRASDATRLAEPLLGGKYDHYTGSVSPDGKTFAFMMAARALLRERIQSRASDALSRRPLDGLRLR